jgi:peptidylprolyl isomerase
VVEKGMDVVNKVVQDDFIKTITIIRNGEAAKKFDASKTFRDYYSVEAENQKNKLALEAAENAKYKVVFDQKVAEFTALKAKAKTTPTGLQYTITKKAGGKKPSPGTNVYINYAGFLENGNLFDSSIPAVLITFGKLDESRAAQGGYQPIAFQVGQKDGLIPGFIEGIEQLSFGDKATIFIPSKLGYGEAGAGGLIPPNANIIFEIELLEVMPK